MPALAAELRYSSDDASGITRKKRGKGFIYLRPDGTRLDDDAELARIRALAIPPAYANVWICVNRNGHLQATGIDARGRKQYRYHASWRTVRDANKFGRMPEFGRALTRIRKRVSADLKRPGLERERVVAAVVRLLDRTLIRVGNEQYVRENKSYGLTTLRTRHVRLKGPVICFDFRGKAGVHHAISVADPQAAVVVRGCMDLPGQELFQYLDEAGARHTVSSSDVNEYLREASGQNFSAKDFRTWYATMAAIEMLQPLNFKTAREAKAHIKAALCQIADRLGNTPTMCRKSYVHPAVLQAFLEGRLACSERRARSGRERLLQLLRRAAARRARPPIGPKTDRFAGVQLAGTKRFEGIATMAVEVTLAPRRMFFHPISWAAIFAALAVGTAVQMLLILAALAFGVSVIEPVEDSARTISLAATGWSMASMVITAFVSGHVAARASGLRRKSDGMLHGAVAWAAMTLIYAVLASTVLGSATAGVFSALRPLISNATWTERVQKNSDNAQRLAEVQRSLEAAGLSTAQASSLVAEMAIISADAQTSADARAQAVGAADRIGLALGWLSAAVLFSLFAGVFGGLSATMGQQRVNRRTDVSFVEARVLTTRPTL